MARSLVAGLDEIANLRVGFFENVFPRQKHDAEMLCPRLLPEARTLYHQHVFLQEKVLNPHVVAVRNVNLRKSIEGAARSDAAHSRNRVAGFYRDVPACAELSAHFDQMILWPFERDFDRILLRMIRRKSCTKQLVDAFDVRLHGGSFATYNSPSDAPSRSQIVFL